MSCLLWFLSKFRPKTRERPDGDREEDEPETQKKSKHEKKWKCKNWRRIFKKKKKVEGDGEAGQSSVMEKPLNIYNGDGAEVLMVLVEKTEPDPADREDLMNCRLDGAEKIISQQQTPHQILDGTDEAAEDRAVEDLGNFLLDENEADADHPNGNEILGVMDLNTETEDEDCRELMNFLLKKTEEQIELLKMNDKEVEFEAITELKENMMDDVETPCNKLLEGDTITEEMDAEGGLALVKELVNVLLEKTEEKIELLNVKDAEAETENLMENMLDDLDGSGEQLLAGKKVPEAMDEAVETETAEDVMKFLLNKSEASMDEGLEMVVEVMNMVEVENDIRAEVEQILNLILDEIELKVTKQQNEVDEMEKINQQILMIKDEEKDIKKDELLNEGGDGNLKKKRVRRGTRGHGRKINYKRREKEESGKAEDQIPDVMDVVEAEAGIRSEVAQMMNIQDETEASNGQHLEKEPTMKLMDKEGGGKLKKRVRRGTRGKGRKINYKKKEEVEQVVENKEPHREDLLKVRKEQEDEEKPPIQR
ncbi:uncharacterized protein LOC134310383 [Trichomycterus rosablanca]|uniref:uncharacterized protein LOC134310383 n=1 Tax=Trichomycterus rosablanca TaxID=2290929 RepID=UPI002F35D72E